MPLNLRLRRTIDPAIASTGEVPWQLRYIGQPEIGNNRPTIVRSCYDIACSENAVEFLAELGCRLEFEYIAKGRLCTWFSLSCVIGLKSIRWGGHLFRKFCKMFSETSQAVGLYCSFHATQTSKGNFQKKCYETFGTSGRPTL